jgi:hypothetical protein
MVKFGDVWDDDEQSTPPTQSNPPARQNSQTKLPAGQNPPPRTTAGDKSRPRTSPSTADPDDQPPPRRDSTMPSNSDDSVGDGDDHEHEHSIGDPYRPRPDISGPGPSVSWPLAPSCGRFSTADRHFYDLPGHVSDLQGQPALREGWSQIIDKTLDEIISKKGPDCNFFNLSKERNIPVDTAMVKWQAYPKNCDRFGNKKWLEADKRHNQDEYCEWEVKTVTVRGVEELKSVTFTTELGAVSRLQPSNSATKRVF